MKRVIFFILLGMVVESLNAAEPSSESTGGFRAVDVYVDSHSAPLAAYQIEIQADQAGVKIVGIEGGEHPAFRNPPFYDPKAIQQERLILAAFSTRGANDLPRGKTRVATIHYQSPPSAPARFSVRVRTAANAKAEKMSIDATVQERVSP